MYSYFNVRLQIITIPSQYLRQLATHTAHTTPITTLVLDTFPRTLFSLSAPVPFSLLSVLPSSTGDSRSISLPPPPVSSAWSSALLLPCQESPPTRSSCAVALWPTRPSAAPYLCPAHVSSPWRVDIPGLHVSRMCVIWTRQMYSVILGSTICALCSSYCPLALHYKLVVKIF